MGEAKRRTILPSLRDWLSDNVVGENRSSFEDFADWVAGMLAQEKSEDPRCRRLATMIQAASLAIVESCNAAEEAGADRATTIHDMCRCLGTSFGYAIMSLDWKDDAPIRTLARPFSEEFRSGVKFAIDECTRDRGFA